MFHTLQTGILLYFKPIVACRPLFLVSFFSPSIFNVRRGLKDPRTTFYLFSHGPRPACFRLRYGTAPAQALRLENQHFVVFGFN